MKVSQIVFLIICQLYSISCNDSVKLHVFTAKNINRTFTLESNAMPKDHLASVCPEQSLYKFIVHGFAETWDMNFRWNWVDVMIKEMLKTPEASRLCIIVLDWEKLAKGGSIIPNYWKAINNMKIAANLMTDFFSSNQINENKMHCIGFSLGAHMCSIFYKSYFNKLRVKPNRITGLDPAGPFFGDKPLNEKLNYHDAYFVDIIHTSGKFGLDQKLGHMDFYQDGGASEVAACDDLSDRYNNVILYEEDNKKDKKYDDIYLNDLDDIDFTSLTSLKNHIKKYWDKFINFFFKKPKRLFLKAHQFFGCSHLMSMRFFLYSINTCQYEAKQCDSLADFHANRCSNNRYKFPRMGYYADKSDEFYKQSYNSFYLHTLEKSPYCKK